MLAIQPPEVYKENRIPDSRLMLTTILKEPQGLRYNGMALVYVFGGYLLGFYGLFQAAWTINALAVVLLAHSMIIAAYLIHECGHQLVFKTWQAQCATGASPELGLWRGVRHL